MKVEIPWWVVVWATAEIKYVSWASNWSQFPSASWATALDFTNTDLCHFPRAPSEETGSRR